MIDPGRVLEPLDEAASAAARLDVRASPAALVEAVPAVASAVERTLRRLLVSAPEVPDSVRLAAPSESAMPAAEVLDELRRRDLVSIELAGTAHQLFAAAARAGSGDVRPEDAPLARRAVDLCRHEVLSLSDRPLRSVTHQAAARVLADAPRPVPPPGRAPRPWLFAAAVLAALAVVVLAVVLLLSRPPDTGEAVAAFRAGRLDVAEAGFRDVLERDPANVTALLYLGRIYRRQQRYAESADVLRAAVRIAPRDATVRRELGHLLLELDRPRAAAQQYERAVELRPGEALNWLGLVRALEAAGDPRAEQVLRRAPPEVRAAVERH